MGMFDEIIVPKSYLKGILDKKDEKLFDTYNKFQTKDFEALGGLGDLYKLYRGRIIKRKHDIGNWVDGNEFKILPNQWEKVTITKEINFYSSFTTKDGDECWFEFKFKFVKGKLDSKELVDKIVTSKESQEAIKVMWDIEQEIFDEYRQKWSYRFWTKVERFCQKLTVTARNRHLLPYELRKTAYKASGRLLENPDCLKWYQDI